MALSIGARNEARCQSDVVRLKKVTLASERMSAAHKKFVFRGEIQTMMDNPTLPLSRYCGRYLALGTLRYLGRTVDGHQIEVEIEKEPEMVEFRFQASDAVNAEDDDRDESSEIVEVDEDEARKKKARHVHKEKAVKKRNITALVLRDFEKLPLAHVGMWVSVTLLRGAPLIDTPTTFRDYEYQIIWLRNWQPAETRIKAEMLTDCFASPDKVLRDEREKYDLKLTLAEAGVATKSNTERIAWKKKLAGAGGDKDKLLDDLIANVTRTALEATNGATLATLCSHCKVQRHSEVLMASFGGLYALAQHSLHLSLPMSPACEQRTAGSVLAELQVDARLASLMSVADLATLYRACQRYEKHVQVFFAAIVPLDSSDYGRPIERWPGIPWQLGRDAKLERTLCAIIDSRLGHMQYDDSSLLQIARLAYELHHEQQKPWRRDDDMFSLAELLKPIYRRQTSSDNADAIANRESYLTGAKTLMQTSSAWRPVSSHTAARMAASSVGGPPTLWFTTHRRYALLASFAYTAICLSPYLVCTAGAGFYSAAPRRNLLCLFAGPFPLVPLCDKVPANWQMESLQGMLDRDATFDNDARRVADLMTFDRIALCDAHLLDTATLARFLRLCLSLHCDVELRGDPVLPSTFATMVASERFRVFAEGEEEALFEPRDDAVHEDPPGDSIRAACVIAANPYKSCYGTQLLRTNILRSLRPDDTLTVALNTCADNQRRWLLCCGRWHSDISACFTKLAQACGERPNLQKHLELLAEQPYRMSELVARSSPYIGYQRRAVLVTEFYRPHSVVEGRMERELCSVYGHNTETVSLDTPFLYIEVKSNGMHVDHRICCNAWAANILFVANHRAELSSQSFVQVNSALPFAKGHTNIVFGQHYRFEDLYAAFVHSTPRRAASQDPYTLYNVDPGVLDSCIDRHYRLPPSPLIDMLVQE